MEHSLSGTIFFGPSLEGSTYRAATVLYIYIYIYIIYPEFTFSIIFFRAETFLKQTAGDARALQESQSLTMFLATHDVITSKLKESLEQIEGYDDLLADVVQQACYFYEFKMYVLPKEKHLLLKVYIL